MAKEIFATLAGRYHLAWLVPFAQGFRTKNPGYGSKSLSLTQIDLELPDVDLELFVINADSPASLLPIAARWRADPQSLGWVTDGA